MPPLPRTSDCDTFGFPVGRKAEDIPERRITIEKVVDADDAWRVSGLVVPAAEELPIAALMRHEQNRARLIENVTTDESCEFSHVFVWLTLDITGPPSGATSNHVNRASAAPVYVVVRQPVELILYIACCGDT